MSVNEISKQWNETFQRAHEIEKALQNVRANIMNSFLKMDRKVLDPQGQMPLMSDIPDFEYYQKQQVNTLSSRFESGPSESIKSTPKPKEAAKARDIAFLLRKDQPAFLADQPMETFPSKQSQAFPSFNLSPKTPMAVIFQSQRPLKIDLCDSVVTELTHSPAKLNTADKVDRDSSIVHSITFLKPLIKDESPSKSQPMMSPQARVFITDPPSILIEKKEPLKLPEQPVSVASVGRGRQMAQLVRLPSGHSKTRFSSANRDERQKIAEQSKPIQPIIEELGDSGHKQTNLSQIIEKETNRFKPKQNAQEEKKTPETNFIQALTKSPSNLKLSQPLTSQSPKQNQIPQTTQYSVFNKKQSLQQNYLDKRQVSPVQQHIPQSNIQNNPYIPQLPQTNHRALLERFKSIDKLTGNLRLNTSYNNPQTPTPSSTNETSKAKSRLVSTILLEKNKSPPPPMPMPKTINDRFSQGRFLGKGKFGDVFDAYDRYTNQVVALKIVQKAIIIRHQLQDLLTQEIKIQTYLNHPNIIKLYGVLQDDKRVVLVLELGSQDALKSLKKNQLSKNIFYQMASAVSYMHHNLIIHRDLKIENIVMVDGQAKLGDFGLAVYTKDKVTGYCGTPGFIAPEIEAQLPYDCKADAYSFGVTIYETLFQKLPSFPLNPIEINDNDLFYLLSGLLHSDPMQRMSVTEALYNPWMQQWKLGKAPQHIDSQVSRLIK